MFGDGSVKIILLSVLIVIVIMLIYMPSGVQSMQNTQGAQNTQMSTTHVNNTRYITLHYTKWCGFCKNMKPVWEQVKITTAGSGIVYSENDEDVTKTPGVKGIPTIIMLDERGYRHKYEGRADFNELRNWCVDKMPALVNYNVSM